MEKKPKIVVIGGGTGSFVVLSGLKKYPVELTAVVTVADSGGSTGRLRTEFGFLPVGDIRQCLAALAKENKQQYIHQLLLYRFSKGTGLKGHNLGNLILTALTDMVGSEPKAIEIASRIFRLKGNVFPVSLNKVDLVAEYEDGSRLVGEHKLDEPKHKGGKRIVKLGFTKPAHLYPKVREALSEADLIVFCPGDLYASLLPNLIVKGMKNTLVKANAPLIYITNLMTRYSQTDNYSAADHVREVEKYAGRKLDKILINNRPIPKKIIEFYKKEKGSPVRDDLGNDLRVLRKDVLNKKLVVKKKGDVVERSLVRHHSQKLAKELVKLIK